MMMNTTMAANVSYEGLQPFLFLILYLKLLDFFDSQVGDIGNEIRWLAFGFHFLGYFIFFGRASFRQSFRMSFLLRRIKRIEIIIIDLPFIT